MENNFKEQFAHLNNENPDMKGFETMDQSQQAIPYLRLAQTMSHALDSESPAYIEGLEQGQFYNSVTKENYGSEVEVVCGGYEHMYIEKETREDKDIIIGYHTAEEAVRIASDKTFGKWKTVSGNSLVETYTYFLVIVGHEREGIIILQLASTMIPVAKVWNRRLFNTILPNGIKAAPYYLKWKLGVIKEQNNKGKWNKITFNQSGFVSVDTLNSVNEERKALPTANNIAKLTHTDTDVVEEFAKESIVEDTIPGQPPEDY